MMRGLLLCCLAALATCQNVHYELSLNPKKVYQYKYEGQVKFGLALGNLAESRARIKCILTISGSAKNFILQVSQLTFEEFNGYPGKDNFVDSPKIAQRLAAQLTKPFGFNYIGGHISDIQASAGVSETVINIVRGILSLFHMTIKTTSRNYQLEELGIHGMCQSSYVTEMSNETVDLRVTQDVDINNCRLKAAKYKGMATAVLDDISKQEGDSVISSVTYIHSVKPTVDGGLITKAHGLEQQFFSPFNVKGGNFKMEAVKEMELINIHDVSIDAGKMDKSGPFEKKGDIMFKFVDEEASFSIIMQNLTDPIPKAMDLIKQLAEANKYDINSKTTEDNIKLYQLLRVIPYEGLETMWKHFAGQREQRNWFLDTVAEVNDARIIKFLENRFNTGDVSVAEAVQALLLSINHLHPHPELVEMAKVFLTMPFSKTNVYLWQTVMLSYGSLVYRNCAYYTPCTMNTVQPLIDIAEESLKKRNVSEMVTALKALGNAGHPGSIKTIMRFLPGVAASTVDLPPPVLSAAVQSLRLISTRDPHSVQDITLKVFLQKTLPVEVRMLALIILFETRPPMALVFSVTSHLLEEKDPNIVSSAYFYLKSLARSTTPENHFFSSACNVAMKILAPKFGRLSYHYSKAVRLDWFDDDFLMGTSAEIYMLQNAANVFPSEVIMKSKFFFIGRILQLLELGVRVEGIMELFKDVRPEDFSLTDFQTVLHKLKNWEALPNDKPAFTTYSRVSGQEWFFLNVNKDFIRDVVQAVQPSAGKESPLWALIQSFQEGIFWHRSKPFLTFEMRYLQATSLGLSLEISKYYQSISGVTVNAKAVVSPPLTENLGQLLSSEVSLKSDGFIGVTKDFWLFYGINTEFFQCGSELKSKIPLSLPWEFSAKINVKEKKFKFDFPLFKQEVEFASISSNVYAVNRNTDDPAKITPLIPKVVEAECDWMLKGNSWRSSSKYCPKSKIYGFSLCVESELQREYYHEEYPLYYFLGYTHMVIKAVPAEDRPENIHLELETSCSEVPVKIQQLLDTLRNLSNVDSGEQGSDVVMASQAHLGFKALAMRAGQQPMGYEGGLYSSPEACAPNSQLIVSQVGEKANWKMCIDSSMSAPLKTKTNIRWGAECHPYRMSVTAETAHLPKPTFKAIFDWCQIPESMAEFGRSIGSYIPGMAFFLGFSQDNKDNTEHEVSASVVVSSADSVDVKVKFPEYTISRHAIPFPLLATSFQAFRNTTAASGPGDA